VEIPWGFAAHFALAQVDKKPAASVPDADYSPHVKCPPSTNDLAIMHSFETQVKGGLLVHSFLSEFSPRIPRSPLVRPKFERAWYGDEFEKDKR